MRERIAAAVLLAVAACSPAPNAQRVSVDVHTAPVVTRSIAPPVELSGNVVAGRQATLSAVVPGRLSQLNVRVGSRVRAGDVVATIDDATYRAQQEQAAGDLMRAQGEAGETRASLTAAQARADLARVTQQRMASLYATGDVSRQAYDQAHSDYVASLAAVAQAAAAIRTNGGTQAASAGALAAASSQLSETIVRAPFDGTIVQKLADPGTVVLAGTPIVQLQDDSALEVDVAVPQDSAASVRGGDSLRVRLDALGGAAVAGRVLSVTAADDPAVRSVLVKVALPRVAGVLPGMYARLELPGAAHGGLAVPLAALVTRAGQTGVFVVSRGVATFAPVRTGIADGSYVLVEGLRAEDRSVAVDDTSQISDGVAVTVRR